MSEEKSGTSGFGGAWGTLVPAVLLTVVAVGDLLTVKSTPDRLIGVGFGVIAIFYWVLAVLWWRGRRPRPPSE